MERISTLAWNAYKEVSKSLPPELQSPQSDLTVPRVGSESFWGAEGAINVVLYLASIGLNPIQEEEVRNFFEKKAARRNYEGKWFIVHQLVDESSFSPIKLYEIVLRSEGPHAFFGNRIRSICRAGKQLRWDPLQTTELRRAKPKQRKRGYDDKGTLGKSKVDPPERTVQEPKIYQSVHSLFFASLPGYLQRFQKLSQKTGIDPTIRNLREQTMKFNETLEEYFAKVEQIRKTPIPSDRKQKRNLRKRCKKAISLQAKVVSLWRELRPALLELEPEALSLIRCGQSASLESQFPPEAFFASNAIFLDVLECFGFDDLVPHATVQRS